MRDLYEEEIVSTSNKVLISTSCGKDQRKERPSSPHKGSYESQMLWLWMDFCRDYMIPMYLVSQTSLKPLRKIDINIKSQRLGTNVHYTNGFFFDCDG